jgi:hypothetical protein
MVMAGNPKGGETHRLIPPHPTTKQEPPQSNIGTMPDRKRPPSLDQIIAQLPPRDTRRNHDNATLLIKLAVAQATQINQDRMRSETPSRIAVTSRANGDFQVLGDCEVDGVGDVPLVCCEDDCGGVAGGDARVEEAMRAGFFVGVAIGAVSEDGLHGSEGGVWRW